MILESIWIVPKKKPFTYFLFQFLVVSSNASVSKIHRGFCKGGRGKKGKYKCWKLRLSALSTSAEALWGWTRLLAVAFPRKKVSNWYFMLAISRPKIEGIGVLLLLDQNIMGDTRYRLGRAVGRFQNLRGSKQKLYPWYPDGRSSFLFINVSQKLGGGQLPPWPCSSDSLVIVSSRLYDSTCLDPKLIQEEI